MCTGSMLITALNPTVTAEDRAAVAERCDGVLFYIEQVRGRPH
jgi:hypothetical protein